MQTWIQRKAQTKTATHSAKAMFLVDYDIMLAHVSLCHTASCNNGTPRVSPIWGLVAFSYENLQLARVISVSALSFRCPLLFSSAVFQSSPESDITEDQRPRNNTMLLHIAFGGRSISTLYSFWDENVLMGLFSSRIFKKDFLSMGDWEKMTPFFSSVEVVLPCGGVGYILWRFLCL